MPCPSRGPIMCDGYFDRFSQALRGGDPAGLEPWLTDPVARRRFAVYRNNVVRGAIEVLRAAYPAVNRIVGDSFFSPLAKTYWQDTPPTARSMTLYGEGFAEHIRAYRPAGGLPYLVDVARLDRAWLEVHHGPDDPVLRPETVAQLDPDRVPLLRPGLAATVRLLALDHDSLDVWAQNRTSAGNKRLSLRQGPAYGVIWREAGQVRHAQLDAPSFTFLTSISNKASLAEAVDHAGQSATSEFAGRIFGTGLTSGWFAAETQDTAS